MSSFDVLDAFTAEAAALRRTLTALDSAQWDLPSPAEPWSVRDQVAHLTFVFDLAAMAAADAPSFAEATARTAEVGFDSAVNQALTRYNQGPPEDVLARYDQSVDRAASALGAHDPDDVVPWLVNPLPVSVLTVAGMVEIFAHGQDVADAVGVTLKRTDNVRHLVPFIHRTVPFGYLAREMEPPHGDFLFAMQLPSGETVESGTHAATNIVCGDAVDLALIATRRRHLDDMTLHAVGPEAWSYLEIAQAYRGPAGPGRQPLNPVRATA